MYALQKSSLIIYTLLLTACVTVNIYFPAAEAEEAARTIVKDVLGTEDKPNEQSNEQPSPEAIEEKPDDSKPEQSSSFFIKALDWFIPTAQAEKANIKINTPAVSKIRKSLKSRAKKMSPHYKSGAIGLKSNGLVGIRKLAEVPLKDRNKVKQLIASDNQDRKALYKEIARANGHPEWANQIQNTFAKVWVEEAPKGYWYQSEGKWKKK